jgi:tetratricopeptide (TPR) repeat protein
LSAAKRKRARRSPRSGKPAGTPAPAQPPPSWRERAGIAVGLTLLVTVVYAPVVHHEFVVLDDAAYYLRNPNLDGRFGLDDLTGAFGRAYYANWIPLTSISIAIDNALYGVRPAGVLVTNALLHAVSCILLFLALARMTGRQGAAAFVAAVFAVHPLHVESVAWASQRKDVLMGVGWTASMLAYAIYRERGRARDYAALVGCASVAMLAKPVSVTLPFALLLLDFWPLRRFGERVRPLRSALPEMRAAVIEKLPLFALAALSAAATLASQSSAGADTSVQLSLGYRVLNAGLAYVSYAWDSVWPAGLAAFYPYRPDALLEPATLAACAAVLAISALCVWWANARSHLFVGWFWFVGTLVPMIGIVHVGMQARADRYMYIPLIGLALAATWSLPELRSLRPGARRAVVAGALACAAALAFQASRQVASWSDSETLFLHAIEVTHDNAFAHGALGAYYREQGELAKAGRHIGEALRIRPDGASARFELAALRIDQGRLAEARTEFERARSAGKPLAEIEAGLGIVEERSGDLENAIAHYRAALKSDPQHRTANNNLAWLLATASPEALRDPAEAIRLAEALAAWNGHDASILDTLAAAYAAAGRMREAVGTQARAVATADGEAQRRDLESRLREYEARSATAR